MPGPGLGPADESAGRTISFIVHPLPFAVASYATGMCLAWMSKRGRKSPTNFSPPKAFRSRHVMSRLLGVSLVLAGIALHRTAKGTLESTLVDLNFTPVSQLATSGPFAASRNPLYLALVLLAAGSALAVDSRWPLAACVPWVLYIHFFIVPKEERYLAGLFGDAFRRYAAATPRWLPGLPF
eukprot:NODE_2153_length_1189_cov_9.653509_g1785_i0.p1 GENE.NODE_2153_length_1189_cov_9.653509_g1785_i0~~NODE_2153_length_1189_cov_9.653509_g1785_i0.p1  ORF type:complete len:182 (-),score=23.07 NODE_2153_length_1189_cov_9.653509_g1785_i0:565-1110(-)